MNDAATVRRALAECGLAPLDAQVLLAHVMGRDRTWVAAHADDKLGREFAETFAALVARRRGGEPIAYLTGTREFWGLPLAVSPAVLIPRPETETLVEHALARLPSDRDVRVLDLGTGSGAIALAIAHERPRARVVATDMSSAALAIARENARRLAIANVEFVESDWYAALSGTRHDVPFDLIASNPPYVAPGDPHLTQGDVRFEPAGLTGDDAGNRAIIAGAGQWLVSAVRRALLRLIRPKRCGRCRGAGWWIRRPRLAESSGDHGAAALIVTAPLRREGPRPVSRPTARARAGSSDKAQRLARVARAAAASRLLRGGARARLPAAASTRGSWQRGDPSGA
jgi:release factor glutamine methyltransferase